MKLLSLLFTCLSVFVVWFMWFPIRIWALSQVPPVQYAGLIKLGILFLIGYFGGVTVPIALLGIGVYFFFVKT
jgi:hypothetical protein